MSLEVLEGTWEEILRHTAELSGQRVRVMVLPPAEGEKPALLDQSLARRTGRVSFAPAELSSRTKAAWGEAMEKKHAARGEGG